jgi:hypothetical protein
MDGPDDGRGVLITLTVVLVLLSLVGLGVGGVFLMRYLKKDGDDGNGDDDGNGGDATAKGGAEPQPLLPAILALVAPAEAALNANGAAVARLPATALAPATLGANPFLFPAAALARFAVNNDAAVKATPPAVRDANHGAIVAAFPTFLQHVGLYAQLEDLYRASPLVVDACIRDGRC